MASTGEVVLVVDHAIGDTDDRRGPVAGVPLAGLLVALSCLLYVDRGENRLWSPRVFAEDGQIFLSGAHNDGLAALWSPYAGYLHVVPRLLAGALDMAPLTWLPELYACVSVAAFLVMAAPVLSARIAWLLPSPVSRAVAFGLLCLLPGGEEVYGNLSNLIFVGGLTLALFAFSDDPSGRVGRVGELIAVALLGLSGPLGAVLSPGFAWRWWRNGRSTHSARIAGVIGATAAIQAAITYLSDRETPGGGTTLMAVQALSERVAGGWLYGDRPLFAARDLPLVDLSTQLWLIAAFVVTVIATVIGSRTAGVVGWLLMVATIGAPVWAYGQAFLEAPTSHQRHLLIPMGLAAVLLVASAFRGNVATRTVAAALLLAGVGGVADNFTAPDYPGSTDDVAELRECDSGCRFPIYDGKWSVVLRPQ